MKVKKTMIFEKEHLEIINGIARMKRMQIKDVLYQLLEHSIKNLDETTRNEARALGKYIDNANKKIYWK